MTANDPRFGPILFGSLLVHGLLLAGLALLPSGGGPAQQVRTYTVKIVETPSIPEARALNLQAPSLSQDAPAIPTAPAPDVTGLEAPTLRSPSATLPPAPKAPSLTSPSSVTTAPALPAPPTLPSPPSAAKVAKKSPGASAPGSAPRAPAAASALTAPLPPSLADAPSPEDRLRAKVRSMNLKVESEPTDATATTQPAETEQSLLNLRLFQNTVRERVKQNYSFPGTFPSDLHARVKVIIERSGKLRSADLMEASGNDRFDKLVCLAAIRNAKYPPLPRAVEGDSQTLYLTCSP